MNELWEIFITFSKIGVLTFGGGLSMLPMLNREIVLKHQWATEEEILDFYAIGQCTPGIIAVNTATFIGYKRKGILGGIIATLGIIAPSILIILVIAAFLQNVMQLAVVSAALAGVETAVCALMLNTILIMGRKSINSIFTFVIFLCAFALTLLAGISPISIVIDAGVIGVICGRRKGDN